MYSEVEIIEKQQKFAQQAYKNFMSKRYGITPCCLTDLESTIIKKEICDWNSKYRAQAVYPTNEAGKYITPFEVVSVKDEPCTDPLPTETNCIVNLSTIVNAANDADTYVHNQGASSNTWVIVHGLNKFPSVTVVDSGNTVVVGSVAYDSPNQVTITFEASFSGKAYLN